MEQLGPKEYQCLWTTGDSVIVALYDLISVSLVHRTSADFPCEGVEYKGLSRGIGRPAHHHNDLVSFAFPGEGDEAEHGEVLRAHVALQLDAFPAG